MGDAAFVWRNPRCPARGRVAGGGKACLGLVPWVLCRADKPLGAVGNQPYPGRVFGKMGGGVRNF